MVTRCCVVLCCVVVWCGVSCRVVSCHVVLCCAWLCCVVLCCVVLCLAVLCRVVMGGVVVGCGGGEGGGGGKGGEWAVWTKRVGSRCGTVVQLKSETKMLLLIAVSVQQFFEIYGTMVAVLIVARATAIYGFLATHVFLWHTRGRV